MTNILILENDIFIAMDISILISEIAECNTYLVADYASAIKVANDVPIDIIVADININGLQDGITTASFLQVLYGCKIIFLTSYADDETLFRASKLQFVTYILKPFKAIDLQASIKIYMMQIANQDSIVDLYCGYRFDKKTQLLHHRDGTIILALKEKLLFCVLLNARKKVVPLFVIDEIVWNGEVVSDTTRRQLLHRLKTKLPLLSFRIVKFQGYIMD